MGSAVVKDSVLIGVNRNAIHHTDGLVLSGQKAYTLGMSNRHLVESEGSP